MDSTFQTTILIIVLPLFSVSWFIWAISGFLRLVFRQHISPLRALRGPPAPSFLIGNLEEMHDQENTNLIAHWEARYGSTFTYRGFIGGCRLMTTDLVAISYVLRHAYDYPKPDFVRDSLASMAAGNSGLLTVEGVQHNRQRKILTPAFSSSHVNSLTPIFWQKAVELRDVWLKTCAEEAKTPTMDVLSWLSRGTLDIIGLAGFGYDFNSIADDTDELATAFGVIFTTARKFRITTILQVWFPFLRRFRRANDVMKQARATMRRIGLKLIDERIEQATAEHAMLGLYSKANGPSIDAKSTIPGRDLLSVLIRSNIASRQSESMSIEEILCQISTFMAAGHETTSSALTWCLYALSQSPSVQDRLRAALRTIPLDSPTLDDDVGRLEYLDWVVRETLRVHAPITSTMRVATRDDEIPVARPFADRCGHTLHCIKVKKHDIISIPIQAVNNSKAIWGVDALTFRPERWESPPSEAKSIQGLYSNILTFLNGNPLKGNRACIGYKFALAEIKIFLYVLLRDIEFSIDPAITIEKRVGVVTRPIVKSQPDAGNQMPLLLRPAYAAAPTSPVSVSVSASVSAPDLLVAPSPASWRAPLTTTAAAAVSQ